MEALNLVSDVRCSGVYPRCEAAFEDLGKGIKFPDVVLLDIGLPGISGIHAIKRFKDRAPRIQIIMLTVFDLDDKITTALVKGASGYLLKTSSTEEILTAVRATMQGGMPLDPMVTRRLFKRIQESKGPLKDYRLTAREKEVLKLMVDGLMVQKMADTLFISPHTVITHIKHINRKLEVNTRSQAVVKAIKENLV
jgi:DNA-binding NarL/FixJ family response regulator